MTPRGSKSVRFFIENRRESENHENRQESESFKKSRKIHFCKSIQIKMQNTRVLFQYFQSVHGYYASLYSNRCNKTQSFDWASLYQVSLDNMVEHRGFEPLTSTLRTLRATNCANAPYNADSLSTIRFVVWVRRFELPAS